MSTSPSQTPAARGSDLTLTLERVLRLIREIATAGGLSSTAATVLGGLARTGPRRLTELARTEGVSQPSMTQLVTRLEHQDLVTRAPDAADGRVVLVDITARGRSVVEERRRQRAEVLDRALDRLSEQERAAIAAALPALDRLVELVLDG